MAAEAYLPADQPRVRSKVWIERDGEVLLSEWRVALLAAVAETGALARAAERLAVPHRTAWDRIKETEGRLGLRLVGSESGGAAGGGSWLTEDGRDLVARFQWVTAGVAELVKGRFQAELADLLR